MYDLVGSTIVGNEIIIYFQSQGDRKRQLCALCDANVEKFAPTDCKYRKLKMWPIVMALLRRNAVYITLPFAAIVGFIGYNVENLISDKYTPYSRKFQVNLPAN